VYLKLMTLDDVQIGFDFSSLVAAVIITGYIAVFLTPFRYPMLNPWQDGLVAITGVFVFVVSLIIHQMSHSIVAMIFGFKIRHIIFSTFGGFLLLDTNHNGDNSVGYCSHKKLKVAVAGPAASFIMASLFGLSWWFESQDIAGESLPIKEAIQFILYYATLFNGFLGLVNLVPALPFDGGLIIRAFGQKEKKEGEMAREISQKILVLISCGLLALASYFLFFDSFFIGLSLILGIWILQSEFQLYTLRSNLLLK
jgi:Zn-dependent protease